MVLSLSLALAALLALAAWRDLTTRTMPDGIALAVALLGLLARALHGPSALATSLLTAAALFAALFLLHARGAMGGGDVKLATGLALGFAPLDTWNFVVATALAGGLLGLLYLALPRLLPSGAPLPAAAAGPVRRLLAVEAWRMRRRGPLPYGVAIAAGGALVLLQLPGS